MGEEFHENEISKKIPDPTLVPADSHFISESVCNSNKDDVSCSLVDWNSIAENTK